MKVYKPLLILLIFQFFSCSNAQCNYKTVERPDGITFDYFNPSPVIKQSGYEVGTCVYKNADSGELWLNISFLFMEMRPSGLNGDLIVQTTNENGIRLSQGISELVEMNGRDVAIALYKIELRDYMELKSYPLKSLFFYLDDQLIGSTVTENKTIYNEQLKCFEF